MQAIPAETSLPTSGLLARFAKLTSTLPEAREAQGLLGESQVAEKILETRVGAEGVPVPGDSEMGMGSKGFFVHMFTTVSRRFQVSGEIGKNRTHPLPPWNRWLP